MKPNNKRLLSKYEQNLKTALYSDYSRNMPRASLVEIEKVVFDETGKSLNTNYNCSHCIMKLLKEAAKLYFNENGK